MQIDVPYPQNMIALLNAQLTGVCQFNYLGNPYYGYVQNIEACLEGEGSAKVVLLSTADNVFTNLIR